jgi:hypothetical protein
MSDNEVIRRGDARNAVIQSTGAMDAVANINALPADPRVEKLVEALQDAVHAWDNDNKSGDMMQGYWVDDARAALAAWEAGNG